MSEIILEPVFLPASRREWRPGYICSHTPTTVCCDITLDSGRVKYRTLTYKRGLPEPLTLEEACLREFLGEDNLKQLYYQAKTLKEQQKILGSISVIGWGLWDFMEPDPVAIVEETDTDYKILYYPLCSRSVGGLSGNTLWVSKDSVRKISTYDCWKYLWCGREVTQYLKKECLPDSIREDIVKGMYEW